MGSTVIEVAKAAGVSTATVSRVFSRHPNIRAEIREKVFSVAKELDYSPRFRKNRKDVAVITPSRKVFPVQAYSDMIVAALSEVFAESNYRMELIPVQNLDMLYNSRICGAISLLGSGFEPDWSKDFDIPLVCINYYQKTCGNIYTVCSNEEQGLNLAIEHLHKHHHRKIGIILTGVRDQTVSNLNRENAFIRSMIKYGMTPEPNLIRYVDKNLYEQVGKVIQSGATAIISSGESEGQRMAYVLSLFGKKVPEDISLITYEWPHVSEYCIPPQTTLCQNAQEISRKVLGILESCGNGGKVPTNTLIDYKLIPRESVGINR